MKEYTDQDIVIQVPGAEEELADAKRVTISISSIRGAVVTRDAEVSEDTVSIHLTPEDTSELGAGSHCCEATILTADGYQVKTETISVTIAKSVSNEILTAQEDVEDAEG